MTHFSAVLCPGIIRWSHPPSPPGGAWYHQVVQGEVHQHSGLVVGCSHQYCKVVGSIPSRVISKTYFWFRFMSWISDLWLYLNCGSFDDFTFLFYFYCCYFALLLWIAWFKVLSLLLFWLWSFMHTRRADDISITKMDNWGAMTIPQKLTPQITNNTWHLTMSPFTSAFTSHSSHLTLEIFFCEKVISHLIWFTSPGCFPIRGPCCGASICWDCGTVPCSSLCLYMITVIQTNKTRKMFLMNRF